MAGPVIAPYGTWSSPISLDLITAGRAFPSYPRFDGEDVWWEEARPAEGGRQVVRHRRADGSVVDAVPAGVDVRTMVHEYGGAAWTVAEGTLYYSDVHDGRLLPHPPRRPPRAAHRARAAALRRPGGRRFAPPPDLRRRGSLRRRRGGQPPGHGRARRRGAGRPGAAGGRGRLLRRAAPLARRPPAGLAELVAPQHAVGRHDPVGRHAGAGRPARRLPAGWPAATTPGSPSPAGRRTATSTTSARPRAG